MRFSLCIPLRIRSFRLVSSFGAALLLAALSIPSTLRAQAPSTPAAQHLVSPSDLQQAAVAASQARQQNLDTLNGFLSSDQARHAIQSANIDPQQVKNAVAGLSDEELAQLSARAQKAQADFAAGYLGTRDLLLIVLAIVALILIIVAVH